ncbi:MAG: hypothetical protein AAB337_01610 [Patescibacteria group bacterium]
MQRKPDYFRRSQFRRYQARRFHNPFFQRPVNKASWHLRLLLIGGFLFFFGLVYLFAFAPFWMVNTIEVDGLQYMSSTPIKELAQKQLDSSRLLIFVQQHPWFFDHDEFKKTLNSQYSFESLETTIEKRALKINVIERVSQVIWFSNEQTLFVDLTGTAIRELTDEESIALSVSGPIVEGPFPLEDRLRGLPRIVDQENEPLSPGQQVLVSGGVEKVLEMNQILIANNLTPDHFAVERPTAAWARAELREGFAVLFDLTSSIPDQMTNLQAVLAQEVKNRATLEYVDIRFGNHVYVQGGE